MDIVVAVAVTIMGIASIVAIMAGPFMIGEERKPFSAENYLFLLLEGILWLIMAGRILRWW